MTTRSCATCGFWSQWLPSSGDCLRHAYARRAAMLTDAPPLPECPAPMTSADDTCNRWAPSAEVKEYVNGGERPASWSASARDALAAVIITPAGSDTFSLHHAHRHRLPMWVVTANPKDYPHGYVARFNFALPCPEPTQWAIFATTIEAVREAIPHGCVALSRHADDEPQIVETWL